MANWTRDECILALGAYMEVRDDPRRIKESDPLIIQVSDELTQLCYPRSPKSVRNKLYNFQFHDPASPNKGLENGGYTTKRVWDEFSDDLGKLRATVKAIRRTLEFEKRLSTEPIVEGLLDLSSDQMAFYEWTIGQIESREDMDEDAKGYEVETIVSQRRGQQVFRAEVLSNFGSRCCITGYGNECLLRAGHIKPWKVCDASEKVDVRNGLCLEPMFDLAFDKGYITVDDEMRVQLSDSLQAATNEETFQSVFKPYAGRRIRDSEHEPGEAYLEYHRMHVFRGEAEE